MLLRATESPSRAGNPDSLTRLDDVVEFLSTDNPVLSNDLTKSTHELITNVHIPEMNIVGDDASTVTGR